LNKLQIDGRITNQDLAKHCNLSPSACFDRTRKLRDNGYISSYVALLDPHLNQRPLLIFIEVLLNRTTGDIFRQFAEATRRQRDILECHMDTSKNPWRLRA
jgi:Lrp/AsnC family leucine-responsive transcriptional regulator